MSYTEEERRHRRAYKQRAYDYIKLEIPHGMRDIVNECARLRGDSVTRILNEFLRTYCGLAPEEWKAQAQDTQD